MQQRPRDPDPTAGQPRPRVIRPHWIDTFTRTTLALMTIAIICAAALGGR